MGREVGGVYCGACGRAAMSIRVGLPVLVRPLHASASHEGVVRLEVHRVWFGGLWVEPYVPVSCQNTVVYTAVL